jgi:hypothetical protein
MKSLRFLLALACAGVLALSVAQAGGAKAASGGSCTRDKAAKECCGDKAACCKDKKSECCADKKSECCTDKKAECGDKAACGQDKKAGAPKG